MAAAPGFKRFLCRLEEEIYCSNHKLDIFLLALLHGSLNTQLFLTLFFHNRVPDHPLVMKAYQLACVAVPLMTLGSVILFIVLKTVLARPTAWFYPFALLFNTLALSIAILEGQAWSPAYALGFLLVPQGLALMSLRLPFHPPSDQHSPGCATHLPVLLVLFVLYFFNFLGARTLGGILASRLLCYPLLAIPLALTVLRGIGRLPGRQGIGRPKPPTAKRVIFEGNGLTARLLSIGRALSRALRPVIPILIVLLLALLVIDPYFYFSDNARYHHNFFLGPANDIRAGKNTLFDSYSQYGLFLPYVLAAVLSSIPALFSHPGFVLVINGLFIVQYALLYFLMRRLIPFHALVVGILALILYFNYFALEAFSLITFPAQGPLRYLWPYVILFIETLRAGAAPASRAGRAWFAVQLALVGLASIWSIEVFLYVFAAYLACHLFRLVPAWLYGQRRGAAALLRFAGLTLAAIAGAWAAFLVLLFVRTGQFPALSAFQEYLLFLNLHVGTEVASSRQITADYPFMFWMLAPAVYLGSLLLCALLCFQRPAAHPKYAVINGLTVYGMLQFAYFFVFQESVHFAFLFIPVLILAFFWLCELYRRPQPGAIKALVTGSYLVIIAMLFLARGHALASDRFTHTGLHYGAQVLSSALSGRPWADDPIRRYFVYQPWNAPTAEAEELVERFFADEDRLLIFIDAEDAVETLFHSGKSHAYPISHPKMLDIIPALREKAIRYPYRLKPGERLLVVNDREKLTALEREIIRAIQAEYPLSPLYTSQTYTVYEVSQTP